MSDQALARVVTLGCHDLRTPLATVNALAKMLARQEGLGRRESRFVQMIDAAGEEMVGLLDRLGLAARIAAGRYDPHLTRVDTVELVTGSDERISVSGSGATVETDAAAVPGALAALALAALLYGEVAAVGWRVSGRDLVLSPLRGDAAAVVSGDVPRDLGALVARMVLEAVGATLAVDGAELLLRLP
jgi:signal transduction histidine kinase